MSAYQELEKLFQEISHISGALEALNWDSASMMPAGGAEARSDQTAVLHTILHKKLTSAEVGDLLLSAAEDTSALDEWQHSNLKLMQHDYKHATAVEGDLVEALCKAGSRCENTWRTARAENDFATFALQQQEVLNLTRKVAQAKSEALGCSLYDALLDQYDAGRRSAEIDGIFDELKAFLPDFITKVKDKQASESEPLGLRPPYPIEEQKALGETFMAALGFDFDHGRLDTSHHPFCGGVADDVRITTRYDANDFTSAMMGVLHETGHALYEQGLPKKYRNQPVGYALGMSVHESQSLLIEMQVCRGRAFLEYAAPKIRDAFTHIGDEVGVSNLVKIYNHVSPGLIRVDADEATYPIHVMIRYEIENMLINSKLEYKDVPELWNKMMKEMLGIDVPDYRDGCMQDVHWTDGSFGYFPTYTLGAMTAAQFYNQAKQDVPEIEQNIARGDFSRLLGWLRKNIHSKGGKLTANELLVDVTGEALNVEIFKRHLEERYL